MKSVLPIFLLSLLMTTCLPPVLWAQQATVQQLKSRLSRLEQKANFRQDTAYANTINQLAFIYADSYPDSALALLSGQAENCKSIDYPQGEATVYKIIGNAWQTKGNFEKSLEYYDQALQVVEKIKDPKALPGILNNIGLIHLNQGNYPEALKRFYEAIKAAEAVNDQFVVGSTLNNIAIVHFYQGKMAEAENDYQQTLAIATDMADTIGIIMAYNNIGEVNIEQNQPAKALGNLNIAYRLASLTNNPEMLVAITNSMGNSYFKLDSLPKAIEQFEHAVQLARQQDYGLAACKALIGLAKVRLKQGMLKEALANGLDGLQKAKEMGQAQLIRDANEIVATIYGSLGDGKNAIAYYQAYKIYSDSLNNIAGERAAANYKSRYEISKKELEFERKTLQQRWIIFSALAGIFSLGVIVWIISRNKKRLNQAYKELQHKNVEIEAQKVTAEETLLKLQAAQSQLIQSEKMASLGELTAGIAHEIQNPLNFVNNFSEVSNELMDEMNASIEQGDMEEAKAIAGDIQQNLSKINHHGKRADAIVKGMLQHSRTSSATKELTDINQLADEYVRLAYHGLRAKDSSFNATIKTDYDPAIGHINLVPQDVGRVILNLITNAFYAVAEKKQQGIDGYEPTVAVSTKLRNGLPGNGRSLLITVRDNGNGIPEKALDKIFQPFFTTKPTGQGTGLGLSISYDIIKAHGGELKAATKAGEFAEFVITLPV